MEVRVLSSAFNDRGALPGPVFHAPVTLIQNLMKNRPGTHPGGFNGLIKSGTDYSVSVGTLTNELTSKVGFDSL